MELYFPGMLTKVIELKNKATRNPWEIQRNEGGKKDGLGLLKQRKFY